MKKWILSLSFLVSSLVWAHGGHDHESAATSRSLKGGQVQRLEVVHVEVVPRGDTIKIYLLELQSEKPQSMNFAEFAISAKAELPRGKGATDLKLEAKDGYFETKFDAKGSHRFNLILSLVHKPTKHSDKLTFVIEPKK